MRERGILVGVDSWQMTQYQEVRILYGYAVLRESNQPKAKNGERKKKLTETKPGELLKRNFNTLFETLVHSSEVISCWCSPAVYPEV